MTGAAAAARRLSNWHRFIVGISVFAVIVETTAVGAIAVATIATTVAVGITAVGTIVVAIAVGTTAVGTIGAATAIRACRDTIAAAAIRGSGEGGSRGGGGGFRGGNDVSVRGRLASNAVTHPMVVLATGAPDPGHVALSPAPFTVEHRAVGRRQRFLSRSPSGVGTAIEWPPETNVRRQRFWWRSGLLLLVLAVEVMVASTARPRLLYSTSTSTRSTTASPRSSIPSTGGLEPSTSTKRVWVGRRPRCRSPFELTHFAGGPGGADNMLHVSAPKKRRLEPGALLDFVVIEKIADEDVNICFSVLWTSIDRRRISNWSTLEKTNGVLMFVVADGFKLPL